MGGLVGGEDLSNHVVDAEVGGYALRRGPVVAGEHDHFNAELVQSLHGRE